MAVNGVNTGIAAYKTTGTEAAGKTQKKQDVKLSKEAQQYLKELKTKYKNMDFTVASYDTAEEAKKYLENGTKEYSVLIDPETLEKMASDKETRTKYEELLNNAKPQFEEMKKELGEDAEKVQSFGIEIDKNGQVAYVANLFESLKTGDTEKNTEKEVGKAGEKDSAKKTKRVTGQSMQELIKKIREELAGKSPDNILSDQEKVRGRSFDVKW